MTLGYTDKYILDFSDSDWEELECLGCEGFELNEAMPRHWWIMLAFIALGKAQKLEEGWYGPEENPGDDLAWASQLRSIAAAIFDEFQPGDGKL